MVYGERGDMRQAPPLDSNWGSFPVFGAEWRHIKVSRSTTLTQQEKEQEQEPQRECVFEKSFSVSHCCIFQLFHLSETLFWGNLSFKSLPFSLMILSQIGK